MALITPENIKNLSNSARGVYLEQFQKTATNATYSQFATRYKSTKAVETYTWLEDNIVVSEFTGERVVGSFGDIKYMIENKTWVTTIGVLRTAIEDDETGQVMVRVRQQAAVAARGIDNLCMKTIENGNVGLCYDGKPYFSTEHTFIGKGGLPITQSNYSTNELTAANIKSACVAMRRFVLPNGENAGIIPTHILVPPELEDEATRLLMSPIYTGIGDEMSNSINTLYSKKLNIIVDGRLQRKKAWYLMCLDQIIKPLIFQDRVSVELDELKENTDKAFMKEEYYFGTRARYNFGYAWWNLSFGNYPVETP